MPSDEPAERKAPRDGKTEAESAEPVQEEVEPWEKLELPKSASEAQKSQFKQLKEATRKFEREAKAYRKKLAPKAAELEVKTRLGKH